MNGPKKFLSKSGYTYINQFRFYEDEYKDFVVFGTDPQIEFDLIDYKVRPKRQRIHFMPDYICDYIISEKEIYLSKISFEKKLGTCPSIEGVMATNQIGNRCLGKTHRVYLDLHIKIDFTGTVLVGKDFIFKYYKDIDCPFEPRVYRYNYDFRFEHGVLIEKINQSEKYEKMRY